MKDLEPLNITDDRKLDKQIAQALSAVPLLFVDEEDECLIYRDGIDDIHGVPYDTLASYRASVDACAAVLPPLYSFAVYSFHSAAGTGTSFPQLLHYNAHIMPYPPLNPPDDDALGTYHGTGETRAEALAAACEVWAQSKRERTP